MKLNKKGFTLVELLAVVVILLLISTIAISSINAAVERNKVKQDNAKIKVIESAAKLYYEEHKNSFTGNKIWPNDLQTAGYLDENEILSSNDQVFPGCVKVTTGTNNVKFEYNESC